MNSNKFVVAAFLVAIIFFITACSSEGSSEPAKNFSAEILTSKKIPRQDLIIYSTPEKYSYENLLHDIEILEKNFPEQIKIVELCETLDGRKVFDIVVGSGDNHILIFGAMHAREYITTQIVMRQLCESIDAANGNGGNYLGISTAELLQNVTIHFVPNSNPDGVAISQFGFGGLKNETVRNKVAAMIHGDFEQWKSNANGVDLNRNFDADWQNYYGAQYPGSERYKGNFPGSEPESAALIRLMKGYQIKRSISYHSCGDVIYWYYKQQGAVLEKSKKFAQRISNETGYYLDADYTALDPAGFKDWAVYKLGVPSLTIETGAENGASIVAPVPISRFKNIWQRNKNVVYATIHNLKYEDF